MASVLQLEDNFQYALLAVVLYSFELILIGFAFPGRIRAKVFNSDFMKAHFGDEYKKATGLEMEQTNGYPDMGQGRYSDKLSYNEWILFANAQRAHYNFLEAWGPQTLFIIVGAFQYPLASAYLGLAAIVGRLLYSIGYVSNSGSRNPIRTVGAILGDLVLLSTLVLAIISCFSFTHK